MSRKAIFTVTFHKVPVFAVANNRFSVYILTSTISAHNAGRSKASTKHKGKEGKEKTKNQQV